MKERSITTAGRRHLGGKQPLKEVGKNRNSKKQETMRKPTWMEVRAWENKGTCKNFLTLSSAAVARRKADKDDDDRRMKNEENE